MNNTSDVQSTHPAACSACSLFAANRACIDHTCPDCASITYGLTNQLNELIHRCPR